YFFCPFLFLFHRHHHEWMYPLFVFQGESTAWSVLVINTGNVQAPPGALLEQFGHDEEKYLRSGGSGHKPAPSVRFRRFSSERETSLHQKLPYQPQNVLYSS